MGFQEQHPAAAHALELKVVAVWKQRELDQQAGIYAKGKAINPGRLQDQCSSLSQAVAPRTCQRQQPTWASVQQAE